jgi:hypothetical protein
MIAGQRKICNREFRKYFRVESINISSGVRPMVLKNAGCTARFAVHTQIEIEYKSLSH